MQKHEVLHLPADPTCEICRVGKLRRKRMVRKSDRGSTVKTSTFNQIVSVDLLDPALVSIDGFRYILTHLDESTGWLSVVCIRNKTPSDVTEGLKEVQRGRGWPRQLKCDDGKEFEGEFESCLRENLVEKLKGIPYRPNTHARHERMHEDINAGVRALLLQAGLPIEWYPYAAKYWVLARNLSWPQHDGKTPFEKRYGTKWTKPIPAFGSGVLVYKEQRESKFETTGRLAGVLGFAIPRVHDHRQIINLTVGFANDLKPQATRRVLEFRLEPEILPFRKLKLRGPEEQEVLNPVRNEAPPAPIDMVEGTRSCGKYCRSCSKPVFRHSQAKCERCRKGPGHGYSHTNDMTCFKQACKCPRLMSTNELVDNMNVRVVGAHDSKNDRMRPNALSDDEQQCIRVSKALHQIPSDARKGLLELLPGDRTRSKVIAQVGLGTPLYPKRVYTSRCTMDAPVKREEAAVKCSLTPTSSPRHLCKLGYDVNVAEVLPMKSAMKSIKGKVAFKKEFNSLVEMGVLRLQHAVEYRDVAHNKDARFVKLKPIMAVKNSEMPVSFHVHKCRIVGQGCIVKNGNGFIAEPDQFPFDKPPSLMSMRCALSKALLEFGKEADAAFFDIDSAYLHAPLLGNPTYGTLEALLPFMKDVLSPKELTRLLKMERPVIKLNQALYGLTRSGSDFAAHARGKLMEKGWKESDCDMNVYHKQYNNGKHVTLVLYVDDGALFGHGDSVTLAVKELQSCFKITKEIQRISMATKDAPIRYLGISVYSDSENWILDSSEYAAHIAKKAPSGRSRTTPIAEKIVIGTFPRDCPRMHRATIGQLLWLSRTTRADIAHSVAMVARCVDRWDDNAEKGLNDILRYLVKHTEVLLKYNIPREMCSEVAIESYCDADHDPNKSTSGHIMYLTGNGNKHLVSWGSRKQKRIATSTAESELISLHTSVQGCVFPVGIFLEEIQGKWPLIDIYSDNETAIKVAIRGFSDAMTHVSKTQKICVKWLAELVKDKFINIKYIATRSNAADIMTKPVSTDVFRGHMRSIGLNYRGFARSAVENI